MEKWKTASGWSVFFGCLLWGAVVWAVTPEQVLTETAGNRMENSAVAAADTPVRQTKDNERTTPGKQKEMMEAKKTGIAIVAPGGYIAEADLQRGIAELESEGYRVFNYYDPKRRYQRFAATDAERVRQIEQAAANPDVTIVMALRGGYGTTRLLPYLDFRALAASGKLFVGHSDFTVFQMALLQQGGISFAGPMLNSDFSRTGVSTFMRENFERCLTSPELTVQWPAGDNPEVDVSGTLWGGNLAMLAHLVGTPWMPDIEGGILFVEDVHEQPYQIERMLLQLDEAGILKKQKALVLGRFSEYRVTDYDNGYDFEAMLAWLRARLTIPVLSGLPFGHVPDKVTLPVGAQAHLVSDKATTRLDLSGYPTIW